MSTSRYNISDALTNFERIILRQMEVVYERQVNQLAEEYANKLKEKLLEVAADYMVKIHSEHSIHDATNRVIVEVQWPHETTEETKT